MTSDQRTLIGKLKSKPEIYAIARQLMDERGLRGASMYAADMIDELRSGQDYAGAQTWGQIRSALLDLSDLKFRDDTLH